MSRARRPVRDAQVIIDMDEMQRWLPHAIEAVWYMRTGNCYSGGSMLCEQFARRVHSQLLQKYGLQPEELPLLTFDVWNWNAPFAQVA